MNKIIWWGSLLLFMKFMCCVSIALVDKSLFGWVLMELALFSFVGIMMSYESEFSYLVGQYSVLYYMSQSLGSLFIMYFWSVGGGWFWFELGLLMKLGVWPLMVPLMLYTTSQKGVLLWYVLTWKKFPLYILTSMGWLNKTLMVFLCCLCLGGGFYYYLSKSKGMYSKFIGVLVVSGLIDSVFLLIFFLNSCSLGLSYFLVYSLKLAYILSFLKFGKKKMLGIGYLLSVSGLPPFASFFIKVQLMQSLISISNWGWILWIIVFFQVLLFIFFLVCWEKKDMMSYFYKSFLLMGLVCLNIVTGIIFLCSLGVSMILNQLKMQDMIGPACQEYLGFHDYGLSMMLGVFVMVGIFLLYLQFSGGIVFDYTEDTKLEFFWTFIPGVILISLALPSLKLLYLMDSPGYSSLNYAVKVVGHQWYWSYELMFQGSELNYDSYMLAEDELVLGDFRLLEVDNPLLFLAGCFNQIYVTSDDVMHSFALPALGIKLDAMPGRLNSQMVSALYVGSYYGQCSEMCGMNHSFMPINMEVVKEIK